LKSRANIYSDLILSQSLSQCWPHGTFFLWITTTAGEENENNIIKMQSENQIPEKANERNVEILT